MFLPLYRVPSPVDKDNKVAISTTWNFHYLPVSAQCDEDVDLTTRKWSMEEACKLIFFVYSMLTSPKKACRHFALFIFLMPAAVMHMPPSSCLFSLKSHLIYLLHHQMWTGQNVETSRKCLRFIGSVCVASSTTFVSVLFLFCLWSVDQD